MKSTSKQEMATKARMILAESGYNWVESNQRLHMIVTGRRGIIDFWPTTGKWCARYGGQGVGVRSLIEHDQGVTPEVRHSPQADRKDPPW